MTIITQPITEKKLKKPLVEKSAEGVAAGGEDVEAGGASAPLRSGLLVTVTRGNRDRATVERARRVSSFATLVVFMMSVFVFAIGILGATYLYKEFNQYKMRHFRGWCSVPFSEPQALQDEREALAEQPLSDLFQSMSYTLDKSRDLANSDAYKNYNTFFDEEFDIDIEFDEYERIEVPDFAHGRRGRFIHDFFANKTGIIDLDAGRCFILPLNRTMVLPPHSMYDLVAKMRNGYYDVNTEIVRESYRVVVPSITDPKEMGYYIGRECANLPSYQLEKVISPIYKRNADPKEGKTVFAEFAGNMISEMHIINLHSAPGNKK